MDDTQDLETKRAAARKAMGGEAYETKLETKAVDLQKKRREAMVVMESPDQRARREAQEKSILDREAAKKQLALDLEREKETLAKRRADEAVEKQAKEEERQNLEKTRQAEFESKQNLIERLRQDSDQKLAPLRTLKTDLAQNVKTENLSATKIALMENERRLETGAFVAEVGSTPRRFSGWIIGAIICGLSLGTIGFVIYKNQSAGPVVLTLAVNSLIFADENQALAVDNKGALEIINTVSQLRKLNGPRDSVLNIYPTKNLSADPKKPNISAVGLAEFLNASQISLTEELSRHFGNRFMIGVYRGTSNDLFWVFTINDWEYSKAAILTQELGFFDRLLSPFLVDTTFSSDLAGAGMVDEVVKNKDARVVKNKLNQTLAIYSFLDQQTLVVTQNEEALSRLIDNFNTPRPGQ
mgnify:CR=1 FL=1